MFFLYYKLKVIFPLLYSMDLKADQANGIKKMLTTWISSDSFELETTFGRNHVVDSNTFLSIAQYLRTKGLHTEPQDDYLNIITPSKVRFTLQGLGVIEQYCTDDSLNGKTFTILMKDNAPDKMKLDIEDYNVRFKMQREEKLTEDDPRVADIIANWGIQKKGFRMIRRWSFIGKGIRVDMSMVRQSPANPSGGFSYYSKFTQANLHKQLIRYEVEVELLHNTEHTKTESLALHALIAGVGEVLRAIQKNVLLIRNSVADGVLKEYAKLANNGSFRGVNPVTLLVKNMSSSTVEDEEPNIRKGYNVTDKADGLRAMGFTNAAGELYLIDQSMKVYRTGLVDIQYANCLLDGEWVTQMKNGEPTNRYLIFDVYIFSSKVVSSLPFYLPEDEDPENPISRYGYLMKCRDHQFTIRTAKKGLVDVPIVSPENQLRVIVKHFEIAMGADIFSKCATMLAREPLYHTDGLIITSNTDPLPDESGKRFNQQFKWKPAKDSTIDFLVAFEKEDGTQDDKISTTVDPNSGVPIQYKTMRLYVGAVENTNFRETILLQLPLKQSTALRPALFYPTEYPDPFANTCNRQIVRDQSTDEFYVMTEDTKEPIQHNSIVEMRYEMQNEGGWQWIPARIRHDKTEILHQRQAKGGKINYSKTMNFIEVAKSVWQSIHNPVTPYMISNGTEIPSSEELQQIYSMMIDPDSGMHKKYYEQSVSKADKRKVKSLVDFHNQYIKSTCLIKRVLKPHQSLLDIACGRGGDINKWMEAKAGYVLGIDIADNNILNPEDGAYERYVGRIKNMSHPEYATKMVFVVGDSSKNIVTGEAGASQLDKVLMQSIFGTYPPESTPPPYVSRVIKNAFHNGADVVACMFAIHYFFKSMDTLEGLLKNLSDTVKVGGHFIGCCFDGDSVFRKLAPIETNFCLEGKKDDSQIWSIRKDYIATEFLPNDSSVGLPISVNFISIGSTYTEYLVSFPFLVEKLKTIGLELVENKMFNVSHHDAQDSKQYYNMHKTEEDYSFLNRWFIFKRIDTDVAGMKIQGEIPMPPIPSDEEVAKSKYYRTFEKTIIAADKEYGQFITVPSSDYSVLKPWHKEQVQDALRKWFPGANDIKLIVDGTSHIGVDAIHFGKMYPGAEIHACEIVPEIAVALQLNIRKLGVPNVIPHVVDISLWNPEDITSWSTESQIDILFVDPPWGGKGYDTVPKLDLYLEAELRKGQQHNPAKNIKVLLAKWLESGFVANVIIKVPKNFNMDALPDHVVKEVHDTRKGKAGKLDYLMLWFKGTIFPPEMRTQKIQNRISGLAAPGAAVEEEKIDDDPRVPYAFGPIHRLPKDDAVNRRLWDMISNATAPSDITELPSTAPIWLDMCAPVLLPDVIRGMDTLILADTYNTSSDPTVFRKYIESYTNTLMEFIRNNPEYMSCFVYPSIDYYMHAMKIAFLSSAKIQTQFSIEGKLYKTINKKLENIDNSQIYSNEYFKVLLETTAKLYDKIKSTSSLQQIVYNEKLWLGAYDVFVRFIVDFRLHYDVRFQRIVYFIKEKEKRLVYESNDSANQPFRTMIGNMVATIINDMTLDDLQFVYDNDAIGAASPIAAHIAPSTGVSIAAASIAAAPSIAEAPIAEVPVLEEKSEPSSAAVIPVAVEPVAVAAPDNYLPTPPKSTGIKKYNKTLQKP